jgi:hypothetical protein
VKTHYSIFAVAQIWFWSVQSIFISHNFHVRKEYDLRHPKLPLASLDGATTNYYNSCLFFPTYFYFLSIFYYYQWFTYINEQPLTYHVNMATMAPPPLYEIMPTHYEFSGSSAKKYQQIAVVVSARHFDATAIKKREYSLKKLTISPRARYPLHVE